MVSGMGGKCLTAAIDLSLTKDMTDALWLLITMFQKEL